MTSASATLPDRITSWHMERVADQPVLCNFINGEWRKPTLFEYISNRNPATNEQICRVPSSTKEDVDLAAKAAKAALPAWKALSYEQRAVFLDRIATEIERHAEDFAIADSEDGGKLLSMARAIDVPRAVANFRFFAGAVRHDEVGTHHMADAINYTSRTPVGIAGLIVPWNLPIYQLTWKVAPALAMGNTVVAKPSELTPRSANRLAQICKLVGLPDGVFNVVHGLGAKAGQAICEHPDINLISFTGGTITGRQVAATAAPLFKKLSLELGGKNATIVFADCDWQTTVAGAVRAAFTNQGQVCLAGSRVLIERPIYEKFVEAMVAEVAKFKCGNPATANFGCVSSEAHREKIESYIALGKKNGARVLCGGGRPKDLPEPFCYGAFVEPTILADLPATHACSVEEIFGPVVTVHPFDTEEEVVRMANGTEYGLAGSLWTTNLQRAHRIARDWNTGMVWINCWLHRDLRVPFGGVKNSGVGFEGGKHSLEFYSNYKNVCVHYGQRP